MFHCCPYLLLCLALHVLAITLEMVAKMWTELPSGSPVFRRLPAMQETGWDPGQEDPEGANSNPH